MSAPLSATKASPPNGNGGVASKKPAANVEPEALVATYWFDSEEVGKPYSATVRFTGRRVGITGNPKPHDRFVKDEEIELIVPGAGPVSITTTVPGLRPGRWMVDAQLIAKPGAARGRAKSARQLAPASWSWRRWALSSAPAGPLRTRWATLAPLASRPAVLPGIYTFLVAASGVVILGMQAAILTSRGASIGGALAATLLAAVFGLLGAKLWYAVLHPEESIIRGGWAVDGFLVIAPLAAAITMFIWQLPIGLILDATTPGLFVGVAVGRVGCFLTGCCSGRCTPSRWGIWSSDQRVGARRVPAQLLESGAGLLIGIVTLPLVLANALAVEGAVFVAAFAVYAVVRQLLLRLRSERRKDPRTLPLTAAAAALVVMVVVGLSLAQGV